MVMSLEYAPICLSAEAVAVHAAHKVSEKHDVDSALIVANSEGIFGQQLILRLVHYLIIIIFIILVT